MQEPDKELNCDYVGVVHGVNRMSTLSQLVIRRLRHLVLRWVRLNNFSLCYSSYGHQQHWGLLLTPIFSGLGLES